MTGHGSHLIVLGRGRLGRSLAAAFEVSGHKTSLISGRGWRQGLPPNLTGATLFLAVPDPSIERLAAGLAAQGCSQRSASSM